MSRLTSIFRQTVWLAIGLMFVGLFANRPALLAAGDPIPATPGVFENSGQRINGAAFNALAVADVTGDSAPDALVGYEVWHNDGRGFFYFTGQVLGWEGYPNAVMLADVNGDTYLDAVYAINDGWPNPIWLNDGGGGFYFADQALGGSDSWAVASGDVDGDTDIDLVFANSGGHKLWLNDGAGNFAASAQDLGNAGVRAVALAPLDNNASLDLVFADCTVYLNDGAGNFTLHASGTCANDNVALAVGNVDGDADLDLVISNATLNPNTVYLNDGAANFSDSGQTLGATSTEEIALGDVDGDTDLDLYVANTDELGSDNADQVWLNNGSGVFIDSGQRLGAYSTGNVVLVDLDGDGDLDAFDSPGDDHSHVWWNDGTLPPVPRYVATSGSDAGNDCADGGNPCATVQHAVEVAFAWDEVLVAGGTYVENVFVDRPLTLMGGYGYTATNWIRPENGLTTVLDGSGDVFEPSDWDGRGVRYPMILSGGTLKMYYDATDVFGTGRIGYATTSVADPTNWTKRADPILEPGTDDAWDARRLEAPWVIKMGPSDYRMWFTGFNHEERGAIGYATSSDGVNWVKQPDPVLEPGGEPWNNHGVVHPNVHYDAGAGTFMMYYVAFGDEGPHLARADSADGITWLPHPANPLFGRDWEWFFWRPQVIVENTEGLDVYKLWYSVHWEGENHVSYAESADGLTWTKHGAPVLSGAPGTWDEGGALDPFVMPGSSYNTYAMWYDNENPDPDRHAAIGVALSADGLNWNRPLGGPLVEPGPNPGNLGRSVVVFDGGSFGSVLDGFEIVGASECGADGGGGAGVAVFTEVAILNSNIHHNVAVNGCGGGGIEVAHGGAHVSLFNSEVAFNEAADGGGINVQDGATAFIENSTILENVTYGGPGGGLGILWGESVVVNNSTIAYNVAPAQGGGINNMGAYLELNGAVVAGNTSEFGEGGGVSVSEGGFLFLNASFVAGNTAPNNDGGGVAAGNVGGFHIVNSFVVGNFAGSSGGGLWIANDGGGGGPFEIVNSDIAGNRSPGEGAGISMAYAADVWALNTIVAGNRGATGIADRDGSGSIITLRHCNTFFNSPDGVGGVTIVYDSCLLNVNPRTAGGVAVPAGVGPAYAADWLAYDYHLLPISPIIDAGTGDGAPDFDFEGDPRPLGGGWDIGADEFVP